MNLFAAELLRARYRRVTWGVPVGLVAAVILLVGLAWMTGGEWAAAEMLPLALGDTSPYVAWFFAALGASLVGAEHSNGGITRVLSVEPRRVRVALVKLVVAAIRGVVGASFALAFSVAAIAVGMKWGPFTGAPGELWSAELGAAAVRVCAGAGVASVLGAVAALLARSTTAALVGLTVMMALVEPVLANVVPAVGSRGPLLALLAAMGGPESAAASLVGGIRDSWTTAVGWSAGLVTLAVVVFSRRDVTEV
ncbi:MAG: hypothetical protein KatS3mg008_2049 [Acidimicrobiales bacterium]|nr:MAG: hypothetical protein KatS3mg008_2049 [Acidimicrobiales bacterium]